MAALDLSDLGMRATFKGYTRDADGHPVSADYDVDASELVAAIDRFRAAAEDLSAAWLALPVGARELYDGATVTLHAHPDRPRFSEEWDAQRGAFTIRYGETWSRVAVEAFAGMTPAQRETVRAEVVAAAGAGVTGEVVILATKHADDTVTFRWERA